VPVLRNPGEPPRLVLKLPHTPQGVASLRRQERALAALHADARLAGWTARVAETVATGTISGRFYLVETALRGRAAIPARLDPATRDALLTAAAAAIGTLHTRTAAAVQVDAVRLARWVDAPLQVLGGVVARLPAGRVYRAALRRLRAELHATLAGRTLATSRIHGDFWPGNLLVAGRQVTGIVDWERAGADELPLHDLLHLLLFTRQQIYGHDEADVIAALGKGICWSATDRALLRAAQRALPGDLLAERPMALLYWLRHMAATLTLLPEYGRNRAYLLSHVEPVLQALAREPVGGRAP
ncbi:MAG TPA: aminoglycoside phosphotransferase family protein, partial [Chloroflexia bacterium]|nr:aminoglycoside phosphotransferase family protein [Chloroflexia bacterium]